MKMNRIMITILCISFLSACNNTKSEQQNSAKKGILLTESKSCYAFTNGKDSISMSIEINNNKAEGDLNFNYYEKDSNKGTFSGNMEADTLWANYIFMSEGVKSTREIVFLRKGNIWIQGYGEVIEKNGEYVFANHEDIRFDNNFALGKVDCNP